MDASNTWNLNVNAEDEYNTDLLVHNFHPSLTKQGLRSQFLRFGHVESVNVTTNSRGNPIGFVRMRTVAECDRAIAGLNGRAPLHWTIKMSAPPAERQRRRREREEARRFEEELQPCIEARLKKMEEHEQKMLQLTREFCDTLDTEVEHWEQPQEDVAGDSATDPVGQDGGAPPPPPPAEESDWPALEGLRACSMCSAPTPGYCQICSVPYCSAECQRSDWPRHKHLCRRQLPLVVSVGSGDEGESPRRSVCLARGDQPRPVPNPAPSALRRPHASSSSGQRTDRRPPTESGDRTTPPGRQAGGPALQTTPPGRQAGGPALQTTPPGRQAGGPALQTTPPGRQAGGPALQTTPPGRQAGGPALQTTSPGRQERQQQQQLGRVVLRPGQQYKVMVCYAADPSAVNLRLLDECELVDEMESRLARQVVPPSSPAGTRGLEVGQLCAARFEGNWYRGEVRATAAADTGYRVHFIDWGNTDTVSAAEVAPLPAALADIPPQAVLAALPWRPAGAGGAWSDRQWRVLAALAGRRLTASVVASAETVSVALFNEDGKSVLSEMTDVARPGPETEREQTLPPQAQLDCDRKHVVVPCAMRHPQLVSAQLRNAALYGPYKRLAESLPSAAESAAPLAAVPSEGCPVLVRGCPLGGTVSWHRAVVEGRLGDHRAVVRLLDWGSLETVKLAQLRQLSPHLCQTPAIGVQFGLHGVSETACTEEELHFFRDKLVGREFLLEPVESSAAQVQARLHLISDTNSFCFNDKMRERLSAGRVTNPAPPAPSPAVSPAWVDSPHKRCRLASESGGPGRPPPQLCDLGDPTLRPGDTLPFLLGQVLGPGRFFGSPLTEENTAAVERLESELAGAMAARPPPACRQPLLTGQLVAVRGTEEPVVWSRAAVVDPSGPELLVRLLDVGYQERVAMERLRPLPDEVARLPPSSLLLAFRGYDRWTADRRRLAQKVLSGAGDEEVVLDLTVEAVGSAGTPTFVTCSDVDV